jgi:hypothetical protein
MIRNPSPEVARSTANGNSLIENGIFDFRPQWRTTAREMSTRRTRETLMHATAPGCLASRLHGGHGGTSLKPRRVNVQAERNNCGGQSRKGTKSASLAKPRRRDRRLDQTSDIMSTSHLYDLKKFFSIITLPLQDHANATAVAATRIIRSSRVNRRRG